MKKNRHFIMFVIMLIMMTMMATLASRQFHQAALVEVFIDPENGVNGQNSFLIHNITNSRLEFIKKYELWRLDVYGENEGVLIYAKELEEVFFIDSDEKLVFTYDFYENLPWFLQVDLEPGMYGLVMIYIFTDSERIHVISIQGHEFVIY